MVDTGFLVLFLILKVKIIHIHHWIWCQLLDFPIWVFLIWNYCFQFLVCWEILSFMGAEFCQDASSEATYICFPFIFLMWYITLIDFCMLNHPCIPGIIPAHSWYIIHLKCYWILFAALFKDFFLNVYQGYCFVIFFSCDVFCQALASGL